jgi:hypothetical protein
MGLSYVGFTSLMNLEVGGVATASVPHGMLVRSLNDEFSGHVNLFSFLIICLFWAAS